MKIFIKVKTGAKENKITPPAPRLIPEVEEWWGISVKEPPIEGRANEAVTKLLAKHLNVPRSQIHLVSGARSKRKMFEISE